MRDSTTGNWLLSRLSSEAREILGALELVSLGLGEHVETANSALEFVYFPEDCLMSVIMQSDREGSIEIGMVGFEGATAVACIEGDTQSPFDTIVQGAGSAHKLSTAQLRRALEASPELRSVLQRYSRAFHIQIACTAFANGKSKLEERLARWLLMVADRRGATFNVTHEFLATMLAVRRSGVTLAIQLLEGKGLVRATRGTVSVIDREGMIAHAAGAYGLPEREYERLLGQKVR